MLRLGLSGMIAIGVMSAAAAPALADTRDLTLPDGFKATVFADSVGRARHIAVRANGDVYVNLRDAGVVALRDTDGDGTADRSETFGTAEGTGIEARGTWLYVASREAVFRYDMTDADLVPETAPELLIGGFPEQRAHAAKTFTFDEAGHIYVNQGVPSNACQEETRTPGSPGQDPCSDLERSGIWRFPADTLGQDQMTDGTLFATGLRHSVAINWNPGAGQVFIVNHGRDQLNTLWPDYYDAEDNARLPAEEMHALSMGSNVGWPFTYYDRENGVRMVAPEYGGDGQTAAEPGRFQDPVATFPAHWAPNDLLFYTGDAFPEMYRGGAFVAFHGSWNRAPLPQGGYNVVFVPFKEGMPSGDWQVFADGFKGAETLASPRDAVARPTGLAQGPDGALYVADSVKGTVWRITYEGAE